jgi:hypothetical protein
MPGMNQPRRRVRQPMEMMMGWNDHVDDPCRCPAGGMSDTERDFFGEPPPCPACIDDDYLRLMGLTRQDAEEEFEQYMREVAVLGF